MLLGQMMHQPLSVGSLIEHAARYHADTEIVSALTEGGFERTTWAEVAANAHRIGSALRGRGLQPGDRVGTLAWNNRRHLELYFGVPGMGMVCHTLNPRLAPEQLVYIVNHAADRILFIERTFVPLIASVRDQLPTLTGIVLLGGRDEELAAQLPGLLFHDELLAEGDPAAPFAEVDETSPSSLCYTSGTTGEPKGVLYSHRSTLLHALCVNNRDGLGIGAADSVMPVVPMFHVNAWGIPYASAAVGARLVMPGPRLDGDSLARLIIDESVTLAAGVPTIWLGLLLALDGMDEKPTTFKRTVVGGSALPPSMRAAFRDRYGVELIHAWGMTETSPLGTLNAPLAKHLSLPFEEQDRIGNGQGRPPYGAELRIVDAEGRVLPNDGETEGELQIRGHWVLDSYFGHEKSALTWDGWFGTGDVSTIDPNGYMVIRDRSKDIIKSGGEWISTVDLENIAVGHPKIANAAAIAARHPKWDERPVICAIKRPQSDLTEDELLAWYDGKVPRWQRPDRVIFVESLPLGATGKIVKATLRETYGDVLWEDAMKELEAERTAQG
ncbi:long-chain fatty acid--CoA ligase [Paracoccus sp. (in: a-proteobacteria)]|uniref:long-chain fatty acid--CoA ligase n=1 Tax=Paracoccus sp. TaxID=267 RepID=UPI0026E004D7|nr:long-chain fatty acid--CoA ligase [Paracoccus sp. (in: a-proteobacteria)]MDO5370541.1 long-chain fatty acid--CoA ligase [Paracoccus sp. (in: a-proteobacteria)]